jgi:hypothetical protein
MADDDGLRQIYGIPGVTGIRSGYVFARMRPGTRREKKKKEFVEEFRKASEGSGEEEKKGVDIEV